MLRVLLVAPTPLDRVSGNATTVSRVAGALAARGLAVEACAVGELDGALERGSFALLHGFHAGRVGPALVAAARARGLPAVITLTGTDVNRDLLDPARRAATAGAIAAADGLIAFDPSVLEAAAPAGALPPAAVIPQSVALPAAAPGEALALRGELGIAAEAVVFLLPAGLRPVKAPHVAIEGLGPLAGERPPVHLVLAGPVRDETYSAPILERAAQESWLAHAVFPPARMAAAYAAADVVLNTSESEGGMANAVLEALCFGRPVIARDIPGNRSIVTDGQNGLIFADASGLTAAARRLRDDPGLRERLGRAGAEGYRARFGVEREAAAHVAFYERVLARCGARP